MHRRLRATVSRLVLTAYSCRMTTEEEPSSAHAAGIAPGRADQPLFIATIGLSSFTLFSFELLAGRLVLPVFGGAPSVWTTALCFFTGVVFFGYLYAHLIATRLGQRVGGVVHLAVAMTVAGAALLAPTDLTTLRYPGMPAALNVLLVLLVVAGAPAFLLATTTPLLSAWFSGRGRNPWWLYAVSNAASLAGLLAYPLLIEPFVPLSAQRTAAGIVLVVYLVLLLGVVVSGLRARPAAPVTPTRIERSARPALRQQAAWLFAAAIPAGLLSATTTHLATDHVSAPLLWIGPLGIYLGSFVIAFSARGRRVLPLAEKLVPAAATLMWVPFIARVAWPAPVLIATLLASFAVLAVAIHGRLALSRPDERHLTGFYLVVSAGGLLATAFVALVAPLVLNDVYEYPILLVGGLVALSLLPGAAWTPKAGRGAALQAAGTRLLPYLAMSALVVGAVAVQSLDSALFVGALSMVGALAIIAGRSPRALAVASTLAILATLLVFSPTPLVRVRSFFGITEVREARSGTARSAIHGTTLHGLQFADARRLEPTAYYVRSGPLGDVIDNLHERRPAGANIGLVGLGIGTSAAYQRPTDSMTYFEIDQSVVDLARDRRYFTYLSDAPNTPRIVIGDGRLSLATEPSATFDLLILDAFSSDVVPAHPLTREAMRGYVRALKPGGVIAFHLTNRHFELVPAVAETARSIGLDARARTYAPDAGEQERLAAEPSMWLVIGGPEDMAWFDAADWVEPGVGPILTDDYSDTMRLLRWR
ncbi:MAG: hypothetical protein FD171_1315 [Actinobacteria bacterium]|nr:MAG: hypothetical protein FD171_1315 [Actinomycetota bacterium]